MNVIGEVILAETIELKSLWTNQRLNVHRIHETVNKWNETVFSRATILCTILDAHVK